MTPYDQGFARGLINAPQSEADEWGGGWQSDEWRRGWRDGNELWIPGTGFTN